MGRKLEGGRAQPVFIIGADGEPAAIGEAPAQAITRITGTEAALGNNELVGAPGAGLRIVVAYWTVQNETAVATTIIMRAGDTNVYRYRAQNQGDLFGLEFAPGREWELPLNTALNMNLDGANQCGFNVGYWIE